MHAFDGRKVRCERGKSVGENGAVRGVLYLREGRSRGEFEELNQGYFSFYEGSPHLPLLFLCEAHFHVIPWICAREGSRHLLKQFTSLSLRRNVCADLQ